MDNIKDYLLDNMEVLKDVVMEINSWDDSLDYLDVHYNDEDFFNTYFEGRAMEAVRAAHYGDYEFTDEYVRFNGYGNLETLSESEFHQELIDYIDDIVESLVDNYTHIHLYDEKLSSMVEEYLEED